MIKLSEHSGHLHRCRRRCNVGAVGGLGAALVGGCAAARSSGAGNAGGARGAYRGRACPASVTCHVSINKKPLFSAEVGRASPSHAPRMALAVLQHHSWTLQTSWDGLPSADGTSRNDSLRRCRVYMCSTTSRKLLRVLSAHTTLQHVIIPRLGSCKRGRRRTGVASCEAGSAASACLQQMTACCRGLRWSL